MTITSAKIKELREMTGAGMMDCKKYLTQADGDIDKAIEAMRKDGQARAAKKAGRTAAEGLVIAKSEGKHAAIIEVNSETDFVAKNDDFKQFVQMVLDAALADQVADLDALMNHPMGEGTVGDARQQLVLTLGENIQVRRYQLVESPAMLASYMHGHRIAVLVSYEGGDEALGNDLAMHIAAMNPMVLHADDVPAELLTKEREIETERAEKSGKPAQAIEKMVEGRLKKFVKEVSLMGQSFIKDPSVSIEKLLSDKQAKVLSFIRYEVGEGIEVEKKDFAQEVMEQVKGS